MISIQKRKLPCSCNVWLHLAYKFTKCLIGWSGKHYGASSLISELVWTTCVKSFIWSQYEISFKLELKQTWKMLISIGRKRTSNTHLCLPTWFHSGLKQAKDLSLECFMNLYSLIKKNNNIQNDLFTLFFYSRESSEHSWFDKVTDSINFFVSQDFIGKTWHFWQQKQYGRLKSSQYNSTSADRKKDAKKPHQVI